MKAIALTGALLLLAGCGGSATRPAAQGGALAFSRCMRSHGVVSYPDPGGNGLLPKRTAGQLGVGEPEFQSAAKACVHLAPNGGQPTLAQVAQYRTQMLGYARCIRRHGVPNMPDPDSRGHLDIVPGSGIDVNSPQFLAAYAACRSRLAS